MALVSSHALSNVVGPTKVNHSSYLTSKGQLDHAVKFFSDLGWLVGPEIGGAWGRAAFVRPTIDDEPLQLSDYVTTPDELFCSDDFHLGLSIQHVSAVQAANAVIKWAENNGFDAGSWIEPGNDKGTEWFVFLPTLFRFAIEFVSVKDFRLI